MPTRLSTAQRNAHADLAADAVDAGTGAGYIEIRTGTQPATVATAATGTLLATITANDPAFSAPAVGMVTADLDPAPESTWLADHDGAAWCRVFDGDGTALRDVGLADGITTSLVTVAEDAVQIASWTVTMPESSA